MPATARSVIPPVPLPISSSMVSNLRSVHEYEFRAMDMGNIMHKVLESLIKEVNKEKLSLAELSEEERDALADRLVDEISAELWQYHSKKQCTQ